jgi:hypothetical protein
MVFDGFPVLALPLQGGSCNINFESELEIGSYCREITNNVEPTSKKLYLKQNENSEKHGPMKKFQVAHRT